MYYVEIKHDLMLAFPKTFKPGGMNVSMMVELIEIDEENRRL